MNISFLISRRAQLIFLLIVSIALRLAFHQTYLPWWAGDSGGYSLPAWAIGTGHLETWDGGRTPGYPLYLLTCELLGGQVAQKLTPLVGQIVTWGQSLLGVVSVVLVYLAMERLLIRPSIRFVGALFYALLVPVAEFEMIILSDFLCLFFTTASVYFMVLTVDRLRRNGPSWVPAILTGVASASAVLVRPNSLFIWIFFMGVLLLSGFFRSIARRSRAAIWTACGACAASGGLLVGAWLIFNFENTGDFTLTPITGIARTSAAYNLFDQVHARDKVLGNIMVKYYRQTNQHGIVARDFVNAAFPEILHHYSEMPIHQPPGSHGTVYMCEYLGNVSNYLLREHPGVWFENTLADLRRTNDFNFPQTAPEMTTDPAALRGGTVVLSVPLWKFWVTAGGWESWPILATYLLTYATVLMAAFRVLRARDIVEAMPSLVPLALSVAAIVCMVAFCALATYFNRYSLPLLPIFLICSAYTFESVCILAGYPVSPSLRSV